MKIHHYQTKIQWTGNEGQGTSSYKAYQRSHSISAPNKYAEIMASSDPSFMGDSAKYNPEELFLSSLSSCHMLWYLHLCSVNKIVVTEYVDNATGQMEESDDGSGRFVKVVLQPSVTIENEDLVEKAHSLHETANKLCFIANSCNFKVEHIARIKTN